MGFAAFLALAGAAAACTLEMPREAQRTAVPTGRLDTRLLDDAVRAEVNYARCQAGRSALKPAGIELARTAEAHSRWMVSARNLTHRSTVSGKRTPAERIRASGVRLRRGSENIGYISRYQIDGAPFRILDAGACRFASYSGEPLPVHTYATLARQIVNGWMASEPHRRNILDSRVDKVATGAAVEPNGPYCGRVWFTQSFAG